MQPKNRGFTEKQFSSFWRAFNQSCNEQGIASADRTAYRKRIMAEECNGAEHMSDLNRREDYERLLYRLAVDSGDYELAARYMSGDERRMSALVEACARQLMQIQGTEPAAASAYVAGVIEQAGFPIRKDGNGEYWLDLILWQTDAIFSALDTHRRRLLKADGWDRGLKFDIGTSYARTAAGRVIHGAWEAPPQNYFHVKIRSSK